VGLLITIFLSPDEVGSGDKMDISIVKFIDNLRELVGFPLKVNSAYRTFPHNEKVGGVPNSAHTKGLAVDISCTDGSVRYSLIKNGFYLGAKRIGIAKTFIHFDIDQDKSQEVVWLYP